MALPILDGNQTAATLSTIITGGAHIPAHTVVSLGSQAISDITSGVSGSVVSISNFPSTQTIAGTVTAVMGIGDASIFLANPDNDTLIGASNPLPITGSVSIGNISADGGQTFEGFLSVKVDPDYYQVGLDRITPEVTVTNLVNTGNFTTRFGTPTTANTVFATSAVTNGQRKYLLIQNVTTGSNVITVGIGFTPTTTQGIQLTAGAGITFESSYIPTGAVYVLSGVTASNFTILEA